MAKVVADQQARGGSRGRPVLVVLVASLILLAVYMVSLLAWSGSQTPPSPSQAVSPTGTSAPASSNASSAVPASPQAAPGSAGPAAASQKAP